MNSLTHPRLSPIRAATEQALKSCQISGLVVAVAYGNGPVETIIVGTDEKGNPLAEDSLFPIASVTKLASALAILRLSDQGAFSVDDSLERFIPEAAAAQYGVTLKQLLTHTAGLPEAPEDA